MDRRAVFQFIQAMADAGASLGESIRLAAARFGITTATAREIEEEGHRQHWGDQ